VTAQPDSPWLLEQYFALRREGKLVFNVERYNQRRNEMKYRMYIATFCHLEEHVHGSQYMVSRKSEDAHADYEMVSVHEDANCALENAARIRSELSPMITRVPKTGYRIATKRALFGDQYAAQSWVESLAAQHQGKVVEKSVMEEVLDETDLEDMEYNPVFKVKLEVTQTKYLTVEIESCDHVDVEDEDDAREKAMELFEDDAFEDELFDSEVARQDAEVDWSEEL